MMERVPRQRAVYLVVSGFPGSGKSTVAGVLASRFGLPLLSKDTIKEVLLDDLGADGVEESRRLGGIAVQTLLALAVENGCGVLDNAWHRSLAEHDLGRLPAPVVEVFCRCTAELAMERYRRRAAGRHPAHFDSARLADGELWSAETGEPVAGGWPVIELDASVPLDSTTLCDAVQVAIDQFGDDRPSVAEALSDDLGDNGGDPACWAELLCPDCGVVLHGSSHRTDCTWAKRGEAPRP